MTAGRAAITRAVIAVSYPGFSGSRGTLPPVRTHSFLRSPSLSYRALFVVDENEFPPTLSLDQVPKIREGKEVRPCGLVGRGIHLHHLPDGEVLITVLHHLPEDAGLPLVHLRDLLDNCLRLRELRLLPFQVPEQVGECLGDAVKVIGKEIREVHPVVLGMEVGERVVLL